MSNILTIRQVLEIMETGELFNLKVVSYNRQKKSGGKILEYVEAQLMQAEKEVCDTLQRPPTIIEARRQQISNARRDPNHRRWYTRNIRIYQNGFPTAIERKIHPPLILEFNGKTVVP